MPVRLNALPVDEPAPVHAPEPSDDEIASDVLYNADDESGAAKSALVDEWSENGAEAKPEDVNEEEAPVKRRLYSGNFVNPFSADHF